jgi:hypothetical protein
MKGEAFRLKINLILKDFKDLKDFDLTFPRPFINLLQYA